MLFIFFIITTDLFEIVDKQKSGRLGSCKACNHIVSGIYRNQTLARHLCIRKCDKRRGELSIDAARDCEGKGPCPQQLLSL
jgi:hypothetical protein